MRTRIAVIALAAAAVVAVPAAAIAAYPFTDGPYSVHDADVDWLYNAGVTKGCTATEYCPSDPVTRAQMASFMHRLSGNVAGIPPSVTARPQTSVGVAQGDAEGLPGTPFDDATSWTDVPGASTQVSVPAGSTATLLAEFTAESTCYGDVGTCDVRVLVDTVPVPGDGTAPYRFDRYDGEVHGAATPPPFASHSVARSVVLGPGTHSVSVQVRPDRKDGIMEVGAWTLVAEAHVDAS